MIDDERRRLGSFVWEILERTAVSRDVVVSFAGDWVKMRANGNATSFTVTERYEFQWMAPGGGQQKFSTSDRDGAIDHAIRMLDGRLLATRDRAGDRWPWWAARIHAPGR